MEIDKIKTIAFFVVIALVISSIGYVIYLETQENKIVLGEDECFLIVTDSSNIAITGKDKCTRLSNICESEEHNLPCEWKVIRTVTGKDFGACECRF